MAATMINFTEKVTCDSELVAAFFNLCNNEGLETYQRKENCRQEWFECKESKSRSDYCHTNPGYWSWDGILTSSTTTTMPQYQTSWGWHLTLKKMSTSNSINGSTCSRLIITTYRYHVGSSFNSILSNSPCSLKNYWNFSTHWINH